MHFFEKNGVCVSAEQKLFVDAFGLKNQNVVVSHAHSDHYRPSSSNTYFMTPQTRLLSGEESSKKIVEKKFGQKFEVNGFEVSMHSSGHIVGSAQLKISNGVEAVMTSDFKLQESLLLKPAEVLSGEILLIETTFGKPEFVFPSREQIYSELEKFSKQVFSKNGFLVLGGYAIGKAQELTLFCNKYLGIEPLVHKKVFEKNVLAKKAGAKIGNFLELDHNLKDSNVLILPPHLINGFLFEALSLQLSKKVECAIATGWKNRGGFKTFPLSDHADFNQLLSYVEQCNPKMVLTHHGFDAEFANEVSKRLKIPAKPLSQTRQKTLSEYLSPLRELA